MSSQSVIVVDWGSTRGRAWLVQSEEVLESRVWERGILFSSVSDQRAFLAQQLSSLIDSNRPDLILGVGMLGSRDGIQEVPYCEVPSRREDWIDSAEAAGQLAGVDFLILPGLSTRSSLFGLPSVMRGEEYEFFSSHAADSGSAVVVLPGTHSKWLTVDNATVHNFETFPTGEMFHQWTTSSALSPLIPPQGTPSAQGFRFGLDAAESGAPIGSALFSLRASVLSGELGAEDLEGAISGVLIGHEVRRASSKISESKRILLGGEPVLFDRYSEAFASVGIEVEKLEVSAVELVQAWTNRSVVRSTG